MTMVRVRVTALNLYRLESGPPKKPGRAASRRAKRLTRGTELSVTRAYYEMHRGALQLLGKDQGQSKTASSDPTELEALRAEAADLGIDFDKRWREKRLSDEIAQARAELEDLDDDESYLEDMTEEELRALAAKREIDLEGLESVDDIIEAIENAGDAE